MNVLIVNQSEVAQLLPMQSCIEVMGEALQALARGQAILPLRSVMWLPEKTGVLAMMPACLGGISSFGLKAISVFPGSHDEDDSHQGAVLLFEARRGRLLAILDAGAITAIRTAAVSGVATRLLARPDAADLAILGSGVQAGTHLDAMRCVRPIRRVRLWSRNPDHARAFAGRESSRHGCEIEVMPSPKEAVLGADLICTVTASLEPILKGEWLAAGAHVNAVGSSVPFARELDTNAVVRSRLFVDRRESTLAEAGDFLLPRQEGALGDDHIRGEIGEILIGRRQARTSPGEITLFKSLGLAVEDLAAAHYVYKKAIEKGMGLAVALGS